MQEKIETIIINSVEYVRKDQTEKLSAKKLEGMKYVIVRTYSAGVFAGYLSSREGKEATLINARRLWTWYGAATLSQLSQDGVNKPKECKFPCEVPTLDLTEIIEINYCTEEARLSIAGVPVWRA